MGDRATETETKKLQIKNPATKPKVPSTPNTPRDLLLRFFLLVVVLWVVLWGFSLVLDALSYDFPDILLGIDIEVFGSVLYIAGILHTVLIWVITLIDMNRKKSGGLWILLSVIFPWTIIAWWVYGRRKRPPLIRSKADL